MLWLVFSGADGLSGAVPRSGGAAMQWTVGAYASLVWAILSIAAGVGLVWYISSHPISPRVDEVREAKAGEITAELLMCGWLAIWLHLYIAYHNSRPEV
jgi:hypothetical protein